MEADRQVPPSPSTRKRRKTAHEAIIASAATLLLHVKAPTAPTTVGTVALNPLLPAASKRRGDHKSDSSNENPWFLRLQDSGSGSGIRLIRPLLNPPSRTPSPPIVTGTDIPPPRNQLDQDTPPAPCLTLTTTFRVCAPQEVIAASASLVRRKPNSCDPLFDEGPIDALVPAPLAGPHNKEVVARATERAAHLYRQQRCLAAQEDRICPYGTLRAAVNCAEREHRLSPGTLNPGTVRARVARGRLDGSNEATTSPLMEIEDRIYARCRELQSVGQLHSKEQVIQLAIAVIEATPRLTERLVEWKKKYSHHEDGQSLVGDGWYRGFRQRHNFQLKQFTGRKKARESL